MSVAPPFAYYGGKTRLASRIAAALPERKHYVEPFAGSLAVLLARPPSPMETANDLDGDLVHFWRMLRDRADDLIRACALTPHSRAEHQAAYEPAEGDIERARRTWVLLTQGRGGQLNRTGWRFVSKPSIATGMPRYLHAYVTRMEEIAGRLAHVSLECRPALEVIEKYGRHDEVLLYVDPPYLHETRKAGGYRHEMADQAQHEELAEALHGCCASVVLSGYPSPTYDALYQDWHVRHLAASTTQGNRAEGDRVEVLWSNRPFTAEDAPAPVVEIADPLLDLIAAAPDDDALTALWEANADAWADEHTVAVRARLADLAAVAA